LAALRRPRYVDGYTGWLLPLPIVASKDNRLAEWTRQLLLNLLDLLASEGRNVELGRVTEGDAVRTYIYHVTISCDAEC